MKDQSDNLLYVYIANEDLLEGVRKISFFFHLSLLGSDKRVFTLLRAVQSMEEIWGAEMLPFVTTIYSASTKCPAVCKYFTRCLLNLYNGPLSLQIGN